MGSKSSSSSATQNVNTEQSLVDSSNGDGSRTNLAIAGGVKGTVNITASDFGAIQAAESISEKALSVASSSTSQAIDASTTALQRVKESTSEAVGKFADLAEQVKTDGAAQTKKLVATVAIVLILAVAAAVAAAKWGDKK